MEQLTPLDRTILRMHLEGHSPAQIVAAVGLSRRTMFRRLAQAKERVADALRPASPRIRSAYERLADAIAAREPESH